MNLYVASSWRNEEQPEVVGLLRLAGHEVYDFKTAGDDHAGFHWSEVDANWQEWNTSEYVEHLNNPIACDGFNRDFDAMQAADGCVLVMPCGRSAHLEAGWFVGVGRPLWILHSTSEPELMYKMATGIYSDIREVIEAIKKRAASYMNGKGMVTDLHIYGTALRPHPVKSELTL